MSEAAPQESAARARPTLIRVGGPSLIERLEEQLKTSGDPVELWYDPELPAFCVDGTLGDTLTGAIAVFLDELEDIDG